MRRFLAKALVVIFTLGTLGFLIFAAISPTKTSLRFASAIFLAMLLAGLFPALVDQTDLEEEEKNED